MSYYDTLNASIQDGLSGKSEGIPFNLEKINNYIPGIQKARLTIIGGSTGSGKTKYANEVYLFTIIDDWVKSDKSYPLYIYYISLEMPKEQLLASYAIRWIYKKYNIILDTTYLLGYDRDNKIDNHIQTIIASDDFKQAVLDFEECVEIVDTSVNAIFLDNYFTDKAKEHGRAEYVDVEKSGGGTFKKFMSYTENESNQRIMFFIDHVSLIKTISGQSKHQMIDAVSSSIIKSRNRYKFTFITVQQLNRSFGSTDRKKLEDMLPKDSDFKDSGTLAEACDVAIGMMSPYRERISNFLGYRIVDQGGNIGLRNRMTVANIVKNRYGQAFKVFPLMFLGELGLYSHLPSNAKDFDYDILNKIVKYE